MNGTNQQAKSERKAHRPNAYFASANGFDGFRSRYGEIFRSENFTRVFVIKGGPGTGKSRFMTDVADACEAAGATGEYFYCSSDPTSLDGVILEKGGVRIALIDGTAPHERDARIPGAIDELINLGEFWDSAALTKERGRILSLCEKKAEGYRRVYRYLHLAGEFDGAREEVAEKCLDREKMERAAMRELRLLKISPRPVCDTRYLSAFGMGGAIRLHTLQENVNVVSVQGPYGTARFYLRMLLSILANEGVYTHCVFPSVFSERIPEGLHLPKNNLLFLENYMDDTARVVNMKRFLLQDRIAFFRHELRSLDAEYSRMLTSAEEAMEGVKEAHFALEYIYGRAMNFEAKEEFTKASTRRILSLFPT